MGTVLNAIRRRSARGKTHAKTRNNTMRLAETMDALGASRTRIDLNDTADSEIIR